MRSLRLKQMLRAAGAPGCNVTLPPRLRVKLLRLSGFPRLRFGCGSAAPRLRVNSVLGFTELDIPQRDARDRPPPSLYGNRSLASA
jgi:hypothetical protein